MKIVKINDYDINLEAIDYIHKRPSGENFDVYMRSGKPIFLSLREYNMLMEAYHGTQSR